MIWPKTFTENKLGYLAKFFNKTSSKLFVGEIYLQTQEIYSCELKLQLPICLYIYTLMEESANFDSKSKAAVFLFTNLKVLLSPFDFSYKQNFFFLKKTVQFYFFIFCTNHFSFIFFSYFHNLYQKSYTKEENRQDN